MSDLRARAIRRRQRRERAAHLFIDCMSLACLVGGFAVLLAMRPLWLAIPLSLLLCGLSAVLAQLTGRK